MKLHEECFLCCARVFFHLFSSTAKVSIYNKTGRLETHTKFWQKLLMLPCVPYAPTQFAISCFSGRRVVRVERMERVRRDVWVGAAAAESHVRRNRRRRGAVRRKRHQRRSLLHRVRQYICSHSCRNRKKETFSPLESLFRFQKRSLWLSELSYRALT